MISKADWEIIKKVLKAATGDDSKYERIFSAYWKSVRGGDIDAVIEWEAMLRPAVEQYLCLLEWRGKLVMESLKIKLCISLKSGCLDERRKSQLFAEARSEIENDDVLGSIENLRIDPFSL